MHAVTTVQYVQLLSCDRPSRMADGGNFFADFGLVRYTGPCQSELVPTLNQWTRSVERLTRLEHPLQRAKGFHRCFSTSESSIVTSLMEATAACATWSCSSVEPPTASLLKVDFASASNRSRRPFSSLLHEPGATIGSGTPQPGALGSWNPRGLNSLVPSSDRHVHIYLA